MQCGVWENDKILLVVVTFFCKAIELKSALYLPVVSYSHWGLGGRETDDIFNDCKFTSIADSYNLSLWHKIA